MTDHKYGNDVILKMAWSVASGNQSTEARRVVLRRHGMEYLFTRRHSQGSKTCELIYLLEGSAQIGIG